MTIGLQVNTLVAHLFSYRTMIAVPAVHDTTDTAAMLAASSILLTYYISLQYPYCLYQK